MLEKGLAAADGRNSEQKGTVPDLGLCWRLGLARTA